jgi:hypothetical protein
MYGNNFFEDNLKYIFIIIMLIIFKDLTIFYIKNK